MHVRNKTINNALNIESNNNNNNHNDDDDDDDDVNTVIID